MPTLHRATIAAGALIALGLAHAAAERPAWIPERSTRAPVVFAPGALSSAADESHAMFEPDGRSVWLLRNAAHFGHWTIVRARHDGSGWGRPEVAPFSGRWADADPFLARDGRTLYFISTRPVDGAPRADTELWRVRRDAAGEWGEPEHLSELASPGSEWHPTLTDDGVLYFGSDRAGGAGATDLWRARPRADRFAPPENLGAPLSTAADEVEPYVAPDGSFLIYAATGQPGSLGAYDLYASRACAGGWSAPRNLGAPVNSASWDFAPMLTPDGRYLVYASNRSVFDEPLPRRLDYAELERRLNAPGNGLRDIYLVEMAALDLGPPCPSAAKD